MRILLIIFFLFFSLNGESLKPSEEIQQIKEMMKVAEENELYVTSWEITYKNELTGKTLKNVKTFLKQKNALLQNEDEEKISYSLVEQREASNIEIHYHLILFKNSPKKATLIVKVVSHKNLHKSLEHFHKELRPQMIQKISLTPNKYTCITARNNDIMKKINLTDKFVQQFELQYTKIYNDNLRKNTEVTEIYGYNKEWNETLVISDRPMNVHIVLLHKTNGIKEVIIGTPILIHEY